MTEINSAWAEHQRKRWMRPNAHLYIRHDAHRFMPPGSPRYTGKDVVKYFWPDAPEKRPSPSAEAPSGFDDLGDLAVELKRLRSELAQLRFDLELRKLAAYARKYSPNQPRVPAGNPDGGQWMREGNTLDSSSLAASAQQFAQLGEIGTLLGTAIVHPSLGGGRDCFYKFSYGIVALRQSANFVCPPAIPWSAATHGRLIKMTTDGIRR
jgi:hypothetical protein